MCASHFEIKKHYLDSYLFIALTLSLVEKRDKCRFTAINFGRSHQVVLVHLTDKHPWTTISVDQYHNAPITHLATSSERCSS